LAAESLIDRSHLPAEMKRLDVLRRRSELLRVG